MIAALALLSGQLPASADDPERISVDADGGPLTLTRYAAMRAAPRPGVILLHGLHGFEVRLRGYERYANALAAAGIDAYLVRYLAPEDAPVLDPKTSTRQRREAYEEGRFEGWAKRVSSAATAILARPDSTGRIGLLGFSLGGYVAAETAARDQRIAALAVLYGGMPEATASKVKRLPPLIELHGEADRNVPLAKGEQLVRLGKAVGAKAEFVAYPNRPHGFDFSDTDPMAADAIARVNRFFQSELTAGT